MVGGETAGDWPPREGAGPSEATEPTRSWQPADVAEAVRLVGQARAEDRTLIIRGRGNKSGWMPAPPPGARELSTVRLSFGGELRTENLTGRFAAGTSLLELSEQLTGAGLWLPWQDLDSAGGCTLGGLLASGMVNPLRLGYGLPRDWVLGLTAIDADGRELRLGGALVKNVAGYDLVHLHLGAWGRLGLIAEVTLRLLPLPEGDISLVARFGSVESAEAGLQAALRGRAQPAALDAQVAPGEARVLARIVGDRAGLSSRLQDLAGDLRSAGPTDILTGDEALAARLDYERSWANLATIYPWRCRVSVRAPGLSAAWRMAAGATALGSQAAAEPGVETPTAPPAEISPTATPTATPPAMMLAGQAGSGVYRLFWEGESGPLPVLERLRAGGAAFVTAEGAAARLLAGSPRPDGHWVSFPPRPPRDQDALERRVRQALSPGGLFNPHLSGPEGF